MSDENDVSNILATCRKLRHSYAMMGRAVAHHPWVSVAILAGAMAMLPVCKYCSVVMIFAGLCVGMLKETQHSQV